MFYTNGSQSEIFGYLGSPKILLEGLWGQNYFYTNSNTLFALFVMLTFILMLEKHWEIKVP